MCRRLEMALRNIPFGCLAEKFLLVGRQQIKLMFLCTQVGTTADGRWEIIQLEQRGRKTAIIYMAKRFTDRTEHCGNCVKIILKSVDDRRPLQFLQGQMVLRSTRHLSVYCSYPRDGVSLRREALMTIQTGKIINCIIIFTA